MALSFTRKNTVIPRNGEDRKVRETAVVDKVETKVPIETEFKSDLVSTSSSSSFFIPEMEKLDKSLQQKLNYVLKRAALATSFEDDDIKTRISIKTESSEVTYLRTFLLLSCANMLGEIFKADTPLSFMNWLDTKNSSYIRNTREDIVHKAIGSLGIIDDEAKASKLIKSVYAQYKNNSVADSNFYFFFKEGLSSELQYKISDNCWIYQDNPLEKWANLQNVKEGYNNLSTLENKRLTNARKRWDSLEHSQKLLELSQFIEQLFNLYGLGIIPPVEKTDKDPIAKIWLDIQDTIVDHRINYLSKSLFNQFSADGEKFKFNEVNCVFKENELYILENEVRDKERDIWLHRLAEWLKTKTDASASSPGETIFLSSKNQALVIGGHSFTLSLEEWIESSIRNIIEKVKV
ncbi:MAG: hypothetical protein MUO34_01870 [Ignavibacteriaceae bacterium]|nr:hypothetical protein [Ignavibacteriaceae bacterium]